MPFANPSSQQASAPECIGVIRVTSDGAIDYRSSEDLSCSRLDVGQYIVQVTGVISDKLTNSEFYWFKASGDDGDNLYTTNKWSENGCEVQTRDFTGNGGAFAFQDRPIVVEIWVSNS